ncbi:MAG: phenylalanine--tRNA ligase subunit beta [Desulfovibrio sp.]|nr:phenylalanine--tRNA ligase subunit beta [Desulfovibrio sp.]
MLLSLSWLREFTPYEGTAEQLGDRLTMLGLELEDILHPYEAIRSIVVGHVLTCEAHPQSDHLHVCKVDVGQNEPLDIVCGAPNVAQGQKVPVALVGTVMPDGMVIKKAKLRGALSMGMICSERELGLTEDHSGIMVLPDTFIVGQSLIDQLDLDREVLDISVTPNRADCLSVLGLARETAHAFALPFSIPERPFHEDSAAPERIVPIDIQAPESCWLYAGRIVSGVKIGPSPMRIRHRLHAVGVRPISNIVDVTNYILFECGQPLHSFDLDKLEGGRIVVRHGRPGEKFTTLDGQERLLTANDLCICDAGRVVALAGVMGGLNTEITDASTNVFLESAVFRPATIRRTSRRLGLSSEASYRFERGIDQQASRWALDRACAMMAAMSGGHVQRGLSCSEPHPFVPVRIPFRPSRVDALLGEHVTPEFDEKTLTGLGCPVEKGEDAWVVTQPSWRPDLTREADLIEEVGRMYGLDTIAPVLPAVAQTLDCASAPESRFAFWSRIKRWGAGLGLNEVVNYSFVGHKDLDRLGLPQQGRISIMNPLSAEQDVLRTVLAPGLLHDLRNNLAQGAQGLRLFELANVFEADAVSETTARETGMLGILLYGSRYDTAWPQAAGDMEYADLKGVVEHLLRFLHLAASEYTTCEEHTFLQPCVCVRAQGRDVGVMGRVKPAVADVYLARKDVWLAELNLETLRELHDVAVVRFAQLPVYPPVRRDITIAAGCGLKVADIEAHVRDLHLPLLEDVTLVDCYIPQQTSDGDSVRNLTFRLTFRHQERTLKDAEVDKMREKVAESLQKVLKVTV